MSFLGELKRRKVIRVAVVYSVVGTGSRARMSAVH
jgi:hypothetical protein